MELAEEGLFAPRIRNSICLWLLSLMWGWGCVPIAVTSPALMLCALLIISDLFGQTPAMNVPLVLLVNGISLPFSAACSSSFYLFLHNIWKFLKIHSLNMLCFFQVNSVTIDLVSEQTFCSLLEDSINISSFFLCFLYVSISFFMFCLWWFSHFWLLLRVCPLKPSMQSLLFPHSLLHKGCSQDSHLFADDSEITI